MRDFTKFTGDKIDANFAYKISYLICNVQCVQDITRVSNSDTRGRERRKQQVALAEKKGFVWSQNESVFRGQQAKNI